jgi:hypothetical protein
LPRQDRHGPQEREETTGDRPVKLPRLGWYWHVLIVVVLFVVISGVAIWFGFGPVVHSLSDIAA